MSKLEVEWPQVELIQYFEIGHILLSIRRSFHMFILPFIIFIFPENTHTSNANSRIKALKSVDYESI